MSDRTSREVVEETRAEENGVDWRGESDAEQGRKASRRVGVTVRVTARAR